jgi:hypothetical protein
MRNGFKPMAPGKRKDKKVSNDDWESSSDPDARIARMKDGTTHLAYKAEHAVDLRPPAVPGSIRWNVVLRRSPSSASAAECSKVWMN